MSMSELLNYGPNVHSMVESDDCKVMRLRTPNKTEKRSKRQQG